MRTEDTVTIRQVYPPNTWVTIKQLSFAPGEIGHFLRLSVVGQVSGSIPWQLQVLFDGVQIDTAGRSAGHVDGFKMTLEATKLDTTTWIVDRHHFGPISPAVSYNEVLFDASDGLNVVLFAVVPFVTLNTTVTFTIGTVFVEYDVD